MLTSGDAHFWANDQPTRAAMLESTATIVCVPHEIEKFDQEKNREHLEPFLDRFRLVALAQHAADVVTDVFHGWGFEDIAAAHFVPVGVSGKAIIILTSAGWTALFPSTQTQAESHTHLCCHFGATQLFCATIQRDHQRSVRSSAK